MCQKYLPLFSTMEPHLSLALEFCRSPLSMKCSQIKSKRFLISVGRGFQLQNQIWPTLSQRSTPSPETHLRVGVLLWCSPMEVQQVDRPELVSGQDCRTCGGGVIERKGLQVSSVHKFYLSQMRRCWVCGLILRARSMPLLKREHNILLADIATSGRRCDNNQSERYLMERTYWLIPWISSCVTVRYQSKHSHRIIRYMSFGPAVLTITDII